MTKIFFAFVSIVILASCTGVPANVTPVNDFAVQQYQGTWYEIARLDHRFERGLIGVSAVYTLNLDGTVKVINKGYDVEKQAWQDAEGKAKFVGPNDVGHLKVSFFGPFYGSYVVFELDDGYQHSFVSGNTHKYLWLLARTPTVSDDLKQRFMDSARDKGFAVEQLIWVDQSMHTAR